VLPAPTGWFPAGPTAILMASPRPWAEGVLTLDVRLPLTPGSDMRLPGNGDFEAQGPGHLLLEKHL
jgi:hypothetical protein